MQPIRDADDRIAAAGPLLGDRRDWSRELGMAALAGLFLGLVGPFGSYLNPSRLVVLAYWVGVLLLGALLFGLTLRPAVRVARRQHVPAVAALAVATLLAAIPLSLLCHDIAITLWPGPVGRIGRLAWYGQTLVIALPLAVCHALPRRPRHVPEVAAALPVAPPSIAPSGVAFLSRLPRHLGRELLALQMEDHYVRAHTPAGSALILIPLRQALAELDTIPGLQVHRSWWVARDAVEGGLQHGRNLRLLLSNGLEAPVSRSNVAAARASLLVGRGVSPHR